MKMTHKINGLFFQPWISDAYTKNQGLYGKLLLIGESHYFDEEEDENEIAEEKKLEEVEKQISVNDFTSAIIEGYINHKWNFRFYRNLGLVFNENDSYEVWKNVAFSNGIQVPLTKASTQPTIDDIKTFIPAFWSLLENLKPEKVLVCSQRMWYTWMKPIDVRGKIVGEINKNGRHSNIFEHKYSDGSCKVIGINHPSSRGFSYNEWNPLVKEFIAMK
jgi:hypothetical protein